MVKLCQLADPAGYRAFDWNLMDQPRDLAYWLDLFTSFADNAERRLREDGLEGENFEERYRRFRDEYLAGLEALRSSPQSFAPITTFTLCALRQAMLGRHGFPDPFVKVKARENEMAAGLYPEHVRTLDALPVERRWEALLRSLFAGNVFDLGAPKTIEMYNAGQIEFRSFLKTIRPRPWHIDDADALIARLDSPGRYHQALIFVDNAGTDIVLGVIPLARELARRGIRVVLAANSAPALNDITIDELRPLLDRLSGEDAVLAELIAGDRLATVASGNGTPLIDLSVVTPECDAEAARSDLLVLEGMGRGIETNWRQRFKCDILRIALLKDEYVARWVGGRVFDPICRFESAA